MAIGWLTALKAIPWSDVIEHTPAVLKGARRLLEKRRAEPAAQGTEALPDLPTLHQRLLALEQTQASDLAVLSETVADLAEQNARLVAAVEVLRWRTRWLGAWAVLSLAGAMGALLAWLTH